jgi:hypothetical protein
MASIQLRAPLGRPLTIYEMDTNLTNLNVGLTSGAVITGGTIDGVTLGGITPILGLTLNATANITAAAVPTTNNHLTNKLYVDTTRNRLIGIAVALG